jgi:sporulation protein YqfC
MKQRKAPIIERICRVIDIPPESVSHTPCIELHGRSLLKIRDGGQILLYTHEKIKVELPKSNGTLTVKGNDLSCSFYNLGAIGINGNIDTVSFVNGEE